MDQDSGKMTEHKRRVRYKGTHPRTYKEKYKELHPERYADTIDHVIQKGNTPAGMHIPIMVDEILSFLNIQPGEIGLDATLGYGGHSSKMLACLQGKGHLYGLDVDSIESSKTVERLENMGYGSDIFTFRRMNFACAYELAREVGGFDFVLADLGVSSMQIDNPERGFSYKQEGPLDLRLDPQNGKPASERLEELSEEELVGMFEENADEPYAEEIAHEIINTLRRTKHISTTVELAKIIENALSFLPKREQREAAKKSCQRCFQALRIDVNREYEVLDEFMEHLPELLKPSGRAAILTFHSGEDRLVKKSMKRYYKEGQYAEIANEVIRPTPQECVRNGRARSTKMRWAIKKA